MASTAVGRPVLTLQGEQVEVTEEGPTLFSGQLRLQMAAPVREQCFYLAYEDVAFPHALPSASRLFNRSDRTIAPYIRQGFIEIETQSLQESGWKLELLSPETAKLTPIREAPGEIAFHFRSSPKTPNRKTREVVLYDYFYPIPLQDCQAPADEALLAGRILRTDIKFDIPVPSGYRYVGPGQTVPADRATTPLPVQTDDGVRTPPGLAAAAPGITGVSGAHRFAFALVATDFQLSSPLAVGGATHPTPGKPAQPTLAFHSRHQEVAQLQAPAALVLAQLAEAQGALPWETIDVVEVDYAERDDIPGLIFLAKPEQPGISRLQFHYTHWALWNLAFRLSRQWWGTMVASDRYSNDWLNIGMSEWITGKALAESGKQATQLFQHGLGSLKFDYGQHHNLLAAGLYKLDPHSRLQDPDVLSDSFQAEPLAQGSQLPGRPDARLGQDSYALQAPALYIKQAYAMRYWEFLINGGEAQAQAVQGKLGKKLVQFLRSFLSGHANATITPAMFKAHLDFRVSPFSPLERTALHDATHRLWNLAGATDFSIQRLDSHQRPDGRWDTEVTVEAVNSPGLKIPVALSNENGNSIQIIITPKDAGLGANITETAPVVTTDRRVTDADVDPQYVYFDLNRFNNSTAMPAFDFFPGNLRTLSDRSYSTLWLPYFFRRPGEPFGFGTGFSTMKYTQPLLLGSVQYAPPGRLTAARISSQQKWANLKGVGTEVQFEKNFENTQRSGLTVNRSPLSGGYPPVSGKAWVVHQRLLGNPGSAHFLTGIGLLFDSQKMMRDCGFHVGGDIEQAPAVNGQGFSYHRYSLRAQTECRVFDHFGFRLRQFFGRMHLRGDAPGNVLFKINDLDTSGHRIDHPDLPRVGEILSFTQDLFTPLPWIEGASGIMLFNRMKLRAFYDVASGVDRTSGLSMHRLYRAAGAGLTLPLGGSLSGIGDIAVLRFSALAVLYASTPWESTRDPSILIDFSGEL